MLSGLFSSRVFINSPSHEKRAVIGMPNPKLQTWKRVNLLNNQTKTPNGVKTFTFTASEPPLACLAWKMLITNGREVNKKGACLKNIIYLCFKNWALAPLQIPASLCEGTFYLLFMLCHHLLKQALEPKSTTVMTYALCVANVGCIMTGSFLSWITMFSRCLDFGGTLHLCFAVSERLARYHYCHIISWLF